MSETRGRGGRLRRLARFGAATGVSALALALIYLGLTADLRPGQRDPDAAYRTLRVERGDLRETVVASGTMEPLVRVPVIAEVSGVIAIVHVEEGDRVQRGQPLFELDRERLSARVAERRPPSREGLGSRGA